MDGQTEHVNQSLEAFLRCFAQACLQRWVQGLSLAKYWYNMNWHSALGKSPFEILHNHPPHHFVLVPADASPVIDLQLWLNEHNNILDLLQKQLLRVQQKKKHYADKKHTFREFVVDGLVFLKLQPYI
jgi:hypothetical protein